MCNADRVVVAASPLSSSTSPCPMSNIVDWSRRLLRLRLGSGRGVGGGRGEVEEGVSPHQVQSKPGQYGGGGVEKPKSGGGPVVGEAGEPHPRKVGDRRRGEVSPSPKVMFLHF